MKQKHVYVPRPELTIFHDTYLKCELIKADKNYSRVKVVSVHLLKGGLLPDLTAMHEDEVINVRNNHVFETVQALEF